MSDPVAFEEMIKLRRQDSRNRESIRNATFVRNEYPSNASVILLCKETHDILNTRVCRMHTLNFVAANKTSLHRLYKTRQYVRKPYGEDLMTNDEKLRMVIKNK